MLEHTTLKMFTARFNVSSTWAIPEFSIYSASKTKTDDSLSFTVVMTEEGFISCSLFDYGYDLTSVSQLTDNDSYQQLQVDGNKEATFSFTGLLGFTAFTMYCQPSALNGAGQSLSYVRSNKQDLETACCHKIYVDHN